MENKTIIQFGRFQWEVNVSLLLFTILYLLFTVNDLRNSVQTWSTSIDRTSTRFFIFSISFFLFIDFILNLWKGIEGRSILPNLIYLAIWIFCVNVFRRINVWTLLVQTNMSLLWILSYIYFFNLSKRFRDENGYLYLFALFMYVFYIVITIYYSYKMFSETDRIPVVNAIYYALAMLPWVMVYCSKKMKKWIYFLGFIGVMFSMKRGAMIAFPLMVIANELEWDQPIKLSFGKILTIIMVSIIVSLILYRIDIQLDGFISRRFSAEELATGSGRMELYAAAWENIKSRDFFTLLIGPGSGYSVSLLGTGIHNEWLEFLFSYGIIGLIIYFCFIVKMIRTTLEIKLSNPSIFGSCLMALIFYLLLSIVSSGYGAYTGIFIFGYWGMINKLSAAQEKGDVRQ